MSFISEKEAKRFFFSIILVLLLAFLAGIGYSFFVGENLGELILEKNKSVAASLCENKVDSAIIAKAVLANGESDAGNTILKKIGAADKNVLKNTQAVNKFTVKTLSFSFVAVLILSFLLIASAVIFLKKRDRLYSDSEKIIAKYNDGDFSEHLASNSEGTVYRLLSEVENLAKALSAKTESEKKTKEFLRDMISDISHQIKTPIAALNMYNDIIAAEPENVEVVENFTKKSRRSIERIENLIKTILNIARLDTKNVLFRKENHKVCEIVSRAIDEFLVRAEVEGKTIDVSGGESETINCDIDLTVQAVANIVKNALDNTESGGKVKIEWQMTPVMKRLTVCDDGKGIYPDDIHNIFKRFYRSKHSVNAQGAGLGLSLAKSIVEGQDGVISVDSKLGVGTKFTISFLT